MRKLEQLQKEYDEFSVQNEIITNLDELCTCLEIKMDDLEEEANSYYKELLENKRWKLEAKIRNFFSMFFEEEEVDYYDDDNAILNKILSFLTYYYELYKRMFHVANQNNFPTLLKLMDFSSKCYDEQMEYYEYSRDRIESLLRGINIFSFQYEDNREVIETFFNQKIEELEKVKEKGKEKKKV